MDRSHLVDPLNYFTTHVMKTMSWDGANKGRKERLYLMMWMNEWNVLFNDALNTFYLQLYGVRHMVKDHSDSEKGNSFRLTARVLLYAPSHRQDGTYHRLCYTSRGALAGTRIYNDVLNIFLIWLYVVGHVVNVDMWKTCHHHYWLAAMGLLYAPPYIQDSR